MPTGADHARQSPLMSIIRQLHQILLWLKLMLMMQKMFQLPMESQLCPLSKCSFGKMVKLKWL